MDPKRGDIVWSADPFKDDETAGRPWLVVGNEAQPFRAEQPMTVALTTSGHERALEIDSSIWVNGGLPQRSYALPWAVHAPRSEDIAETIGRLQQSFVDRTANALHSYSVDNSE